MRLPSNRPRHRPVGGHRTGRPSNRSSQSKPREFDNELDGNSTITVQAGSTVVASGNLLLQSNEVPGSALIWAASSLALIGTMPRPQRRPSVTVASAPFGWLWQQVRNLQGSGTFAGSGPGPVTGWNHNGPQRR